MIFNGRLVAMDTPTLLRERIPGKVFELETEDATKTTEILKQTPGIAEVSPFGRRLHILTETEAFTQRQIRQILTKAKISIATLEQVPPRLEDVFIYVAQQSANEKNKTPK
jgi:ABC-2 type transport system ATP-binding protein